jgi:preprotein translocase subunit SecY
VKKFIQTLKNIWSIEELRSKILFTLLLIVIYRVGSFIAVPGINPVRMAEKAAQNQSNGILDLINTFAGGAFNQASIFALGIMPYISASIFMQLMTVLVPRFQKMQKEGDSGRKKINQYTRYLTVGVTLLQASAYVRYLENMATGTPGMIIPAFTGTLFLTSTVVT